MGRIMAAFMLILGIFAANARAEEAPQAPAEGREEKRRPMEGIGFGLGIGLPYGGLGGNVEAVVNKYLSLSLGLGYMGGSAGPGWAGGVKVYPLGRDMTISPRLSAYYGTVAILERSDGHKDLDTGMVYGIGAHWRTNPNIGIDADVLYVDYDLPPGFVSKEGGDIALTIGYTFYF